MNYIYFEIPFIPFSEGEIALKYFENICKIEKKYLWQNGFCFFFKNEIEKIKGPKIIEEHKIKFFKEKFKNYSFKEENNYLYAYGEKNHLNFLESIKKIPWIRSIKIFDDYCCRPVKKIYSSFSLKFSYCGISMKKKNEKLIVSKLENIEKKKNKILNFFLFNKIKINFQINFLLHNTKNPHLFFLQIPKKYKIIPKEILSYILSKELNLIHFKKGFFFILNKSYEEKKIKKSLNLSLTSRLEDILFSYQRDKNFVKFSHELSNNKEELWQWTKNLNIFFKFFLNENKIKFIISNHNNDYCTLLGEEYPDLLGIISGSFYKGDEEIKKAFFSYNGKIQNKYGLLIFLSEKLFYIKNISILPTGNKDPLGLKSLVDKIIDLLLKFKLNLPEIPEIWKKFFFKRVFIKYNYDLSSINFSEALETINYINKNKNLIFQFLKRIKSFLSLSFEEKIILDTFSVKKYMKKVNFILNKTNIKSNSYLINDLNYFYINMKNILKES